MSRFRSVVRVSGSGLDNAAAGSSILCRFGLEGENSPITSATYLSSLDVVSG